MIVGKANSREVCNPNRSCIIVEEMGFVTPFIIAHEIGHMYCHEIISSYRNRLRDVFVD